MSDEMPESKKIKMRDFADPNYPEREELTKVITAFVNENKEAVQAVVNGIGVLGQIISRVVPGVLQIVSGAVSAIQKAQVYRQKNYPIILNNLDYLANRCWFLSMEVGIEDFEQQALILESIPDDKNRDYIIDASFIKFYEEHFAYLSSSIIENFPERAFAISPAIEAHKRGEYALSIPVFFAQADGILLGLTELELFSSRKHISALAQEKVSTSMESDNWIWLIDTTAWKPLSDKRPFGWSPNERTKNAYTGINRNTILHGLDLEYATEVNSFKAFSLLAYIASLRGVLKKIDTFDEPEPK